MTTLLNTGQRQNTTLSRGEVTHAITALKQQPGKNIGISGSVILAQSPLRVGLIDELQLMRDSPAVGSGKRLFPDGSALQSLKQIDSHTFNMEMVYLTYQVDTPGA